MCSGIGASVAGLLGKRNPVHAQELTGSIRVGYEGTSSIVEPIIESAARSIEDANDNVTIDLEPSPGGNYITQLVLQLNGGRAPDCFLVLGVGIAELADAGFLAPLESHAERWDGWSQYPEQLKSTVTYRDSVWAIPYLRDTHFLYYRKDIFEQAGLPTEWQPETPEEIQAFARAVKESVPGVIPYALYAGANGGNGTVSRGFVPLVYAHGGELKDENRLWVIDSCAIRAALDPYHVAYQVDKTVPQDVMTTASPSTAMRQAMLDGELGILYEGCWVYGDWLEDDAEQTESQIGFAQFPTATGGPPFAVGGIGTCWFVNERSENKDLAWTFIEAFNSRENQVYLNLLDPHIPARQDAADDPAFQETEFTQQMVQSADNLLLTEPDSSFRDLIGIVQNATGLVATGDATPDEAATRYADELARVLGEDNVVSQPCP